MKANLALWPLAAALILLAACNSQPAPNTAASKPAAKAPEALTGREAFQKLYVQARGWASDALPVRLESTITSQNDGHGGKAAVWRCTFASQQRQSIKPYTWVGTSDIQRYERGVTPGSADGWTPANASESAFDAGLFKFDSEAAWKVAQEHGGEKLLQAEPKRPVQFSLDWDSLRKALIWHVIYGESSDAKLRVVVNAYDGTFVRIEK